MNSLTIVAVTTALIGSALIGGVFFSFSSFVDMEFGAGWAASETIAMDSESPNQVAFRTGPRVYLGLVGLQRVFVGLNIDYYPINEVGEEYEATGTRVSDNWALNIVVGWRFLF